MLQNLMFIILVIFALFLDGRSYEASDKINWLFIGGRSRTRLQEASSSCSSVLERGRCKNPQSGS